MNGRLCPECCIRCSSLLLRSRLDSDQGCSAAPRALVCLLASMLAVLGRLAELGQERSQGLVVGHLLGQVLRDVRSASALNACRGRAGSAVLHQASAEKQRGSSWACAPGSPARWANQHRPVTLESDRKCPGCPALQACWAAANLRTACAQGGVSHADLLPGVGHCSQFTQSSVAELQRRLAVQPVCHAGKLLEVLCALDVSPGLWSPAVQGLQQKHH